ncbi:MAG TPA: ECF-type sigma factor [Terriglobia bacterium]|nr:ECF-type sigma factor [Terriglobia bacterium]
MLIEWSNGDRQALDRLIPVVYEELRRQASRYLRRERPDQTLQTTDLIHEAYLRLVDQKKVLWQNRAHFFAISATLIRRILIDHARRRRRAKRGGSEVALVLNEELLAPAGERNGSRCQGCLPALTHRYTLTPRSPRSAMFTEFPCHEWSYGI